jgi:hypothetical protein
MQASKWVSLTLGIILAAICFAVKWSQPDATAPVQLPAVTVKEKASPAPGSPSVVTRAFGSGKDFRKVTYRMSKGGSPLTCDIHDEKGNRLVKCRFGYDAKPGPSLGQLVEVQMFDARHNPPNALLTLNKQDTPMIRRIVRAGDKEQAPAMIDLAPRHVIDGILGTALAGFNPMTNWNLVSAPAVPR